MRYFLTSIFLSGLLFVSCTKDKVEHPFAGDYDCTAVSSYWDMNGGSSSSTWQEIIAITLADDSIDVLGTKVPVDDIVYGETFFFGASYNYVNFRFEQDSLFITRFGGGLGGGTTTSYAGRKIN